MQFQAAERRVPTPRDNSSFYGLNPDTADFAPGSLYSVRHTVTRWMRRNGVPAWEVAAQPGHKSRDYRTTELSAALSRLSAERRPRH
jgi:integrase